MENFDWIDMMEKMQDIRLFSTFQVRRLKNGNISSTQELDLLSRIILSDVPLTPLEMSELTGLRKSALSRLIENLLNKGFITKEYNLQDKRSYTLHGTEKGNRELEQIYRYYLEPIYELRRQLGEERFESLITQIREANRILQGKG